MKFTRKEYKDSTEKKKDFTLGVGIGLALNLLLLLGSLALNAAILSTRHYPGASSTLADAYPTLGLMLGILPLLINIGLIIYFAVTRNQLALGLLTALGLSLLIITVLGVFFAATCFTGPPSAKS